MMITPVLNDWVTDDRIVYITIVGSDQIGHINLTDSNK